MKTVQQTFKLFLMVLVASLSFSAMADSDRYGKQKVVYHVNYDNAKKQSGALRNIQNHINAVGADNLDIRVVMHGNGLSLILKPEALKEVPKFNSANATQEMVQKIDKLKLQGVSFNVCANTLKGKNVDIEKHLYDASKSDVVPSGVAELAYLQGQGFSYLRP